MTTASELFYNRRSRLGRNTIELGLDSSLDRSIHHNQSNRRNHHNNNNNNNKSSNNNSSRRDRHDPDGCDPLRRSPHIRLPSHRPSHPERESVRLDQGGSQSAIFNHLNSANVSSIHDRARVRGNDRLPGAVVLARERLLERLRGPSSRNSRRSYRASSGINHDDFTHGDNFTLIDAGDWETETSPQWAARVAAFTDQLLVPSEAIKRPPGLSKEALDCLQLENFSNTDNNDEIGISRASEDCSICLESFLEGEELICLPCKHRFHSCCLDPWVRACGDCPNCRTGIVVNSYKELEKR
ncbi:probable E3 ubiquitin-protein ligase RHY1A [Cornus florida]|uniref:probable E3 ubiquitin-protein ligase RHY1A n=1 Tax=Cornus florida TaxID=4283 RepID=UPI002896817C|nr:probable E3 ubiquitin-protein ligase RHY1A [Cornus florida]